MTIKELEDGDEEDDILTDLEVEQRRKTLQRQEWARRVSRVKTVPLKKKSEPVIPVYRYTAGDYCPPGETMEEEEEEEGDSGPEPEPEVRKEVTEQTIEPDGRRAVVSKTRARTDEIFPVSKVMFKVKYNFPHKKSRPVPLNAVSFSQNTSLSVMSCLSY